MPLDTPRASKAQADPVGLLGPEKLRGLFACAHFRSPHLPCNVNAMTTIHSCEIPGCARKRNTKGLCLTHHKMRLRGDDPYTTPVQTRQSTSGPCSVPGCPRPIRSKGMCRFHQVNGPDAVPQELRSKWYTDEARLMHYRKITREGCWETTASRIHSGYGMIWSNAAGRQVLAHRLAWEVWRGPIGEGLEIDHLCRNRGCFNPDHLQVVTPLRNKQLRHERAQSSSNPGF